MRNELSVASMTKLAKIANEAAAKAEQCACDAVQEAVKCGDALNAAKEKCPHGEWETWIEGNFHYSLRTAQQFMKLAKAQHAALLDDCKSVRQALIAVSEVEKKAAIGKPQPVRQVEVPAAPEVEDAPVLIEEEMEAEWEEVEESSPQPVSNSVAEMDPVVARAKAAVPDLCRKLGFNLGNLGAANRFDVYLREMEEFAR